MNYKFETNEIRRLKYGEVYVYISPNNTLIESIYLPKNYKKFLGIVKLNRLINKPIQLSEKEILGNRF